MLQPLAGLGPALLQLAVAAGKALLLLLGADLSAAPLWRGCLGDSLAALCRLHHSHGSPALIVAAWLLARGGDAWRSRRSSGAEPSKRSRAAAGARGTARLTRTAQRVRMKFRVALLLARNPWLRSVRAHSIGSNYGTGEEGAWDPNGAEPRRGRVGATAPF